MRLAQVFRQDNFAGANDDIACEKRGGNARTQLAVPQGNGR